MSRPNPAASRPLSLTEELEKLEQSITLTLQEIDHNFSRAHRIVTGSILPVVEKYAEHSKAVWEGSKFWKQFFEASANVSLNGVEDQVEEGDSYAQSHDQTSTYGGSVSHRGDETLRTEGEEQSSYDMEDDSLLDNGDISGSTPRAPRPNITQTKPIFADYESPYEHMRKEMKNEEDDTQLAPTTPGRNARVSNISTTPDSSPFDPTSYIKSATTQKKAADLLLHRVLDKNYRIQATPLKSAWTKDKTPANKPSWQDEDSPMSSPIMPPQLHTDIFSSPIRQQYSRPSAPRTPGVSINPTPAKGKSKDLFAKPAKKDEITWESDSDEDAEGVYRELGMSPPKTIQFSLPQSRLLQTPAREASKRIVEDLLQTAGAAFDDTDELDSPSMVIKKQDMDDSF